MRAFYPAGMTLGSTLFVELLGDVLGGSASFSAVTTTLFADSIRFGGACLLDPASRHDIS